MAIAADIQSLDPGAIVELFVLDATSLGGGVSYFHAGTNGLGQSVIWQGNTYSPWPIQAQGFDLTTQGKLPRPKMAISNIDGSIGALVRQYNDLLGAKVIRRRTFVRYLDAANFSEGNPTADPDAHFPDDIYFVDQKTSENKLAIEFTLAAQMDFQGVTLPRRIITLDDFPGARR